MGEGGIKNGPKNSDVFYGRPPTTLISSTPIMHKTFRNQLSQSLAHILICRVLLVFPKAFSELLLAVNKAANIQCAVIFMYIFFSFFAKYLINRSLLNDF